MRTRDIMTSPVVTVPPEAQLKAVAAILVQHAINAVPVVDPDGRLLGIVSEADLLALETAARGGQPHTAREVMSQSVYTLAEDTDAAAPARMMLRHGLKSVPVVAGDLGRQLVVGLARTVPGVVEVRSGDVQGPR